VEGGAGVVKVARVLALVGLVATACGGSTPAAAVHSPKPTPPVQDCRGLSEVEPTTPSPPPGVTFVQMTVDGKLRDYRLFIPPALKLTSPAPLAIVLHGAPIDAAGFENIIHFDRQATTGGFIEASPNGCDGLWSYADGGPKKADEDFIEHMVLQVEARYPIDQRVASSPSAPPPARGSPTCSRVTSRITSPRSRPSPGRCVCPIPARRRDLSPSSRSMAPTTTSTPGTGRDPTTRFRSTP
jgi:hypothetical protein